MFVFFFFLKFSGGKHTEASTHVGYSASLGRKMRGWRLQANPHAVIKAKDLIELNTFLNENPDALTYSLNLPNRPNNYKISHVLIEVKDRPPINMRRHMLFYDEEFVLETRDGVRWFIDATFGIVPNLKHVTQFLTVMIEQFGKVSNLLFFMYKLFTKFFILFLSFY